MNVTTNLASIRDKKGKGSLAGSVGWGGVGVWTLAEITIRVSSSLCEHGDDWGPGCVPFPGRGSETGGKHYQNFGVAYWCMQTLNLSSPPPTDLTHTHTHTHNCMMSSAHAGDRLVLDGFLCINFKFEHPLFQAFLHPLLPCFSPSYSALSFLLGHQTDSRLIAKPHNTSQTVPKKKNKTRSESKQNKNS